jgi:LPXTG-motif cell wall-anchored protein
VLSPAIASSAPASAPRAAVTGDFADLVAWVILVAIGLIGLVLLVFIRRRR